MFCTHSYKKNLNWSCCVIYFPFCTAYDIIPEEWPLDGNRHPKSVQVISSDTDNELYCEWTICSKLVILTSVFLVYLISKTGFLHSFF